MTSSDSEDENPSEIVTGLLAAIASGGYALVTGMLDPSWLIAHSGQWFSIATVSTQLIGPNVAPNIPWTMLTVAFALVFVAAMLIKIDRSSKKQT